MGVVVIGNGVGVGDGVDVLNGLPSKVFVIAVEKGLKKTRFFKNVQAVTILSVILSPHITNTVEVI